MPKNDDKPRNREYRSFDLSRPDDSEKYIVRGHAATFEPYTLYSIDGVDYNERISRGAFTSCDMSDVVFRIDHCGKVYARTSAGTLKVNVDDTGLGFEADLSKSASARSVADDIAAGNYPQASFVFMVEADHYEPETHTRVIDAFSKIYDVSPVTFAANPTTNVETFARDYFTAQEEAIKKAREQRSRQRKRLMLKLKLV